MEDQDSHNSALKAVKEELVKGQERLLVEHRRLCELQRDLSDAESRERQLSNLINSTEDKKSDTLDESGKAEALLSLVMTVIVVVIVISILLTVSFVTVEHDRHHHHGHYNHHNEGLVGNKNEMHPNGHHHDKVSKQESHEKALAHTIGRRVIHEATFAATLAGTSSKIRGAALGGLPSGAGSSNIGSAEELAKVLDTELTKAKTRLSSLTTELEGKDREMARLKQTVSREGGKLKLSDDKLSKAEVEKALLQKKIVSLQREDSMKAEAMDAFRRERAGLRDELAYLERALLQAQQELATAKEKQASDAKAYKHRFALKDASHHEDLAIKNNMEPTGEVDLHAKYRESTAKAVAHDIVNAGHSKAIIRSLGDKHVADKEKLLDELGRGERETTSDSKRISKPWQVAGKVVAEMLLYLILSLKLMALIIKK